MTGCSLHIIGGNDRGKVFELTRPQTRIGRGTDQDIVLADIAVSRRHVVIDREGARYRLRDLGSGNGTLVNSQRVDNVLLNQDDHIEIGNTMMRFEDAAQKAASAPAQPSVVQPSVRKATNDAPATPDQTPSDPAIHPAPLAVAAASTGFTQLQFLQPLIDTQRKQLLTFGVLGFLMLIGAAVSVQRFFLTKPVQVQSDGEKFYRQGLALFEKGDYGAAKAAFEQASSVTPESPEIRRYIRQCDTESHAKTTMDTVQADRTAHHFVDAIKAIDTEESTSIYYDELMRIRRETAPVAAQERVEQAQKIIVDDPANARAALNNALELDPHNQQAIDLLQRLKTPGKGPDVSVGPVVTTTSPPPKEKRHKEKDKEAAVDKTPVEKHVKEGTVSIDASRPGLAAYRNKDFATAEESFRLDAKSQPPGRAQKFTELADQLKSMRAALEAAQAEESRNPESAARAYDIAINIDKNIAHGLQSAFLHSKAAKIQLALAQSALSQGRLEVAYKAATEAQKGGVGDGGVLKQLEGKAADLVAKGVAVQKSNVGQAKTFWRTAYKIVPETSPNYKKAYELLNNASAAHRDEDED